MRSVVRRRSLDVRPDVPVPGPVRTCVGCRRRAAKSELLRVTAGSDRDGRPAVVPDPTCTAPGRGAYVHPDLECLDLAVRRRSLTRALRDDRGSSAAAPVREFLEDRADSDTQSTTEKKAGAAAHEPSMNASR